MSDKILICDQYMIPESTIQKENVFESGDSDEICKKIQLDHIDQYFSDHKKFEYLDDDNVVNSQNSSFIDNIKPIQDIDQSQSDDINEYIQINLQNELSLHIQQFDHLNCNQKKSIIDQFNQILKYFSELTGEQREKLDKRFFNCIEDNICAQDQNILNEKHIIMLNNEELNQKLIILQNDYDIMNERCQLQQDIIQSQIQQKDIIIKQLESIQMFLQGSEISIDQQQNYNEQIIKLIQSLNNQREEIQIEIQLQEQQFQDKINQQNSEIQQLQQKIQQLNVETEKKYHLKNEQDQVSIEQNAKVDQLSKQLDCQHNEHQQSIQYYIEKLDQFEKHNSNFRSEIQILKAEQNQKNDKILYQDALIFQQMENINYLSEQIKLYQFQEQKYINLVGALQIKEKTLNQQLEQNQLIHKDQLQQIEASYQKEYSQLYNSLIESLNKYNELEANNLDKSLQLTKLEKELQIIEQSQTQQQKIDDYQINQIQKYLEKQHQQKLHMRNHYINLIIIFILMIYISLSFIV